MTRGITPAGATPGSSPVRRRARGSISRLPSGSLRVQVYVGLNPITGQRQYLRQTVPAGPTAVEDAEATCRRLLTRVRERRHPQHDVTLTDLLCQHLSLIHAGEHTRRSHRWMIGKHVDPLLGHLRLTAVTPQLLDLFYAELLRCREHCRHPSWDHVCRPLHPATVRKIHYVISGAFRRAVRWG